MGAMRYFLFLGLVLAACGGTPTGSCNVNSTSQGGYCQEYTAEADVLAVYQSSCPQAGGVYSASACTRTGAVGGCRTTNASPQITITNWFYSASGATAQSVMQACDGSGTFVAP